MSTAGRASTGAIVLGASYRALGVVRSLGRRGIPVWIVCSDAHRIARHSRYALGTLPWPARAGEQGQVEHLLALAQTHRFDGWTLIPTDDESAALVARHAQTLSSRFVVAAPEWEIMRWAYDKRLTHELAQRVGVGQPRTWLAQDGAFDEPSLVFPAILKPAFKRERNRFTTEKAWPVNSIAELHAAFAAARELVAVEEILLQELIPGGPQSQLSFAALAADGEVIASLAACRARQYPMDFGRESTFVYTIDAPDVEAVSVRLIAEMRYSGLVEVEFKRDARDGQLKLLDINPRVWGWQSLGPRAGVDFIDLQWRLLHGERPPRSRARVGVRWVRGCTDAGTCLRELLARRLSPLSYLASLAPPRTRAMLALDDPLPGLLDAPLLATSALARRLEHLRQR